MAAEAEAVVAMRAALEGEAEEGVAAVVEEEGMAG